ncbi:hypothetical protein D3C84_1169840 [compost metagenome]
MVDVLGEFHAVHNVTGAVYLYGIDEVCGVFCGWEQAHCRQEFLWSDPAVECFIAERGPVLYESAESVLVQVADSFLGSTVPSSQESVRVGSAGH